MSNKTNLYNENEITNYLIIKIAYFLLNKFVSSIYLSIFDQVNFLHRSHSQQTLQNE